MTAATDTFQPISDGDTAADDQRAVTVRMTPSLHTRLKRAAGSHMLSMNQLMIQMAEHCLGEMDTHGHATG